MPSAASVTKTDSDRSSITDVEQGALLHHLGLRTPWWEWPRTSNVPKQVIALKPDQQPAQVPLRSRLLAIGGACPLSLQALLEASVRIPSASVIEENGIVYFAVDVRVGDSCACWRVRRRYSEFRDFAKRLARAGMSEDADGVEPTQPNSRRKKKLSVDRCAKASRMDLTEVPAPSFAEKVRDVADHLSHYCRTDLSCDGAGFPRRCVRHCEGASLAHRRHNLELWLRVLLVSARRLCWPPADDAPRDVVGRSAQLTATGRVGRVTRHHPDDDHLTYKVEFEDDLGVQADWYAARDVDLLPPGWRPWMADIPCFLGKGRTTARRAPLRERGDDQEQLSLVLVRVPFDVGPGQELGVLLPGRVEITIVVPCGTPPAGLLRLWYDTRERVLGVAG